MRGVFVTGTDTGVGKTVVSCALLHGLRAAGHGVIGMKPVAAGCAPTPQGLRNDDALALLQHGLPAPYELVNPFAYAPPIAPHLAAQAEQRPIALARIEACYRALAERAELVLVEGAGGWRVPLSAREDLAGLAAAHALPVILVVGLRLGCISQARLTAEAIAHDGLRLAGWIGSLVEPAFAEDDALYRDNLATLASALPAPCLGVIPRLPAGTPRAMADSAAGCLELPDVH